MFDPAGPTTGRAVATEEPDGRPRGRDEVVAALLSAATKLFSERGPASVSLRDVAREADVNVGLIHRHIGGKDDLLAAVLRTRPSAATFDGRVGEPLEEFLPFMLRTEFGLAALSRLQARTILDGYDLQDLQGRFPIIEHLFDDLRMRLPEDDARARGALLAAMVMGWRVFGPMMIQIAGATDRPIEEVVAAMQPAIDAFLAAPPSGAV